MQARQLWGQAGSGVVASVSSTKDRPQVRQGLGLFSETAR